MKNCIVLLLLCLPLLASPAADKGRVTINLNGTWQFDQAVTAFPPARFTRTIPVPGLVHLAEPKIEDYDKFFKRPDKVEIKDQHNLYNTDYTPRYSWYRKMVFVPKELEGREAMITVKKSQYVTQVYANGTDLGSSMACYTPVEFPLTNALKYGAENEILIRVGDRVWLPAEAAGGTDKEKEHYLPGIWDDVELSFTGKVRVNRLLVLPDVAGKKVTVKAQLRNLIPAQIFVGDAMKDSVSIQIAVSEKLTGKEVARKGIRVSTKRDNLSEVAVNLPLNGFTPWTPEKPFLYLASVTVHNNAGLSDAFSKQFGMRDFTRKGKFFYLNGEKYILRGTNVTLQRFFEDPDCSNLVWDKAWVKRLLVDYPKQLNWNAMRVCVGIAPDFWYDMADEYGLLFQNEWLYWQNHGWDDQIRKEYTDWLWTDGSHPSIAIWDAINENWDNYIGNILIPELKKLDPTRIWDSGYMKTEDMPLDEMDEPHPYQGRIREKGPASKDNFYPLGDLDYKPARVKEIQDASTVQLANEYGWIWLWRNGKPSKLTVEVFEYYLGKNSTPEQNRELQAYWLSLETEWLRSEPSLAGVLAFCYLANNYGYTGDWFIDNIRDLKPGPTLDWLKHAFAPAATYINLTDERYTKYVEPHKPESGLLFTLAGVNNHPVPVCGTVTVKIYDSAGKSGPEQSMAVTLPSYLRKDLPVAITLPREPGGYLLVAEFRPENGPAVLSRRFIRIGEIPNYTYYNLSPGKN
jgi:hypothetical protein